MLRRHNLNQYYPGPFLLLATQHSELRKKAIKGYACDETITISKFLAGRRLCPSHTKVRSTTKRLAITTKPFAPSACRTIEISGPSDSSFYTSSTLPAYPLGLEEQQGWICLSRYKITPTVPSSY
jgi:hypothetical protein